MKKVTIITIMLVCLSCVLAYAEIRVKEYEELRKDARFKEYIDGVGVGITWANTALDTTYGVKLFCIPGKLVLGVSNYIRILDDSIKDERKRGTLKPDDPIEGLLLIGLQRTFPCPK